MTQEEIAAQYEEIIDAIATHRNSIERLQIGLAMLRRDCTHPNTAKGSDMKDRFTYCVDCRAEGVRTGDK